MVQNASDPEDLSKLLRVKLKSGGSMIKVKPLFSHDSKFLIVASHCDLKIYSIVSGKCFHTLTGHNTPIVSLQKNKENWLQVLSCAENGIVIRWDYVSGVAIKVYDLKMGSGVSSFYAPGTIDQSWFVTTKIKNTEFHRLCSLAIMMTRVARKIVVLKQVHPDSRTIAFGVGVKFVAGVFDNKLQLYDCTSKIWKSHTTGVRKLTCVASHPSEYLLATGDDTGRVLIWANMLTSNHPAKRICHWHTLPVADLAFSAEGSNIYSGGGESALVKWNLNSDGRRILPRMGLPICFVATSHDSSLVATSHTDNAVQVISAQNQVIQIIQGLTLGNVHLIKGNSVAPTGLQYDPRTSAIVLNGRPGHLQFYKLYEDKQQFSLDIVGRNVMSQERNSVILNLDVDKAALDHRGSWLATAESRDDGETSPEIYLKFWNFELTSQKFTLNTSIYLPHYKKINCIKFRPPSVIPKYLYPAMAVTSSDDRQFKVWVLNDKKEGDSKTFSWSCESMGYYKDFCAGDISFSEDGSLLAVAFSYTVTLWEPDPTILKTTLFQPKWQDSIQQLIFGRSKCSHLLVGHSGSSLIVWDILTFGVRWILNSNIECIAGDPRSEVMVAFTKDKNMYVFSPDKPQPLAHVENISTTPVISALFVPRQHPVDQQKIKNEWLRFSEIYFLNKDKELKTVYEECGEELNKKSNLNGKIENSANTTTPPFSVLQAVYKKSSVKLDTYENMETNNEDKGIFKDTVYENPTMLCQLLIPSLLIKNQTISEDEHYSPEISIVTTRSDSEDEEPTVHKIATHIGADEVFRMETEECRSNEIFVGNFDFITKFLRSSSVNMSQNFYNEHQLSIPQYSLSSCKCKCSLNT